MACLSHSLAKTQEVQQKTPTNGVTEYPFLRLSNRQVKESSHSSSGWFSSPGDSVLSQSVHPSVHCLDYDPVNRLVSVLCDSSSSCCSNWLTFFSVDSGHCCCCCYWTPPQRCSLASSFSISLLLCVNILRLVVRGSVAPSIRNPAGQSCLSRQIHFGGRMEWMNEWMTGYKNTACFFGRFHWLDFCGHRCCCCCYFIIIISITIKRQPSFSAKFSVWLGWSVTFWEVQRQTRDQPLFGPMNSLASSTDWVLWNSLKGRKWRLQRLTARSLGMSGVVRSQLLIHCSE